MSEQPNLATAHAIGRILACAKQSPHCPPENRMEHAQPKDALGRARLYLNRNPHEDRIHELMQSISVAGLSALANTDVERAAMMAGYHHELADLNKSR